MTTNDMIADVTAKLEDALDAVKETVATAAETLAELVGLTETEAADSVTEDMRAEVAETDDDAAPSDDEEDDMDDEEEEEEDSEEEASEETASV